MSKSKTRAALAQRAAPLLSLLALVSLGVDTSAAGTRVLFQQQVSIGCSNGACYAKFADLPANQALDVVRVWCQILAQGNVYFGRIYPIPSGGIIVPFELVWHSAQGTTHFYNLKADADMRVPAGRQLIAEVSYSGAIAPTGYCSFTGFKLIA